MKVAVSHASRPKVGEVANGDAVLARHEGDRHLVAVVDGLGHGRGAEEASQRARQHLETVALDAGLREIMQSLHHALRSTRGAAAMVCLLRDGILEGCGVGNVELRVVGSALPVVLSPGILGSTVRQFRVFGGPLGVRSRMVLFSDGISARFSLDALRLVAREDACHQIITKHGHAHDDATVMVVDREA